MDPHESLRHIPVERGRERELLQARVEQLRLVVEQTEAELEGSNEKDRAVWENRLTKRRRELEEAEEELHNQQASGTEAGTTA